MKLFVTETARLFDHRGIATGVESPKDWFDVLGDVGNQLGAIPVQKLTWRELFGMERAAAIVAWQPSALIMAATGLRKPVTYLCWGLPSISGRVAYALKLARLRVILSNATTVLVNDPVTKWDVFRLSGREAIVIPYVVDTDFFQWREPAERSEFLLVPGSNDRNERLVSAIADATQRKVIRVTQSRAVVEAHAASKVVAQFNISYPQLVDLYQRASCVLLPIHSENHAAGQSAVLEAVACGSPVVMSQGRTSALAEKFGSVVTPSADRLEDWLSAIAKTDEMLVNAQHLLSKGAARVRREHAPDVVAAELMRAVLGPCLD